MNKSTCQTIQTELDLLMLGERGSPEVLTHLSECHACSEFQAKQTKLREIVGSLGTVSAPADFDFRLRARLANERASGLSVGTSWLFGPKSVAVGSLALVLAVAAFIGYKSKPTLPATTGPKPTEVVAVRPSTPPVETASINPVDSPEKHSSEKQSLAPSNATVIRSNRNQRNIKRVLATNEYSSTGVEGIKPTNAETTDSIFSIDASLQPYKVSLYDGRGKARTISVAPVSFGSQRAIPTSNQFAPKGIW